MKIKDLNYIPVFDKYQTIILRNQFRQLLNDYYQKDLKLLSFPVPMIKEMEQNDYFDLLNSINFSTNKANKVYQFTTNKRTSLLNFLHDHNLANENGLYHNAFLLNTNCNQEQENIINEYDFLEIKIRIDDYSHLFVVEKFNEIWQLIMRFIKNHDCKNNKFLDDLTQISIPFLDLEINSLSKNKIIKRVYRDQIKSSIFTNKVIICRGANAYNQFLSPIYDNKDLKDFWNLVFVDQNNEPQLLISAFFDQITEKGYKQATLTVFFNFSLALALVTQKRSITELNFLYCTDNQ